MAGPKGSALSMLMDIVCGVISGAGYAGGVGDQFTDWERPQNVATSFSFSDRISLSRPRTTGLVWTS